MKSTLFLLAALITPASASFGAATIDQGTLLFTGPHAQEVKRLLDGSSARTRNFITVVGQLRVEGRNVRLLGDYLGELDGQNDPRLNQLGNAFGVDTQGRVHFRGTLAAYLVDLRRKRSFLCRNTSNSGVIGFPGTITSACLVLP